MQIDQDQTVLFIKLVRISTGFLMLSALIPLSFIYPFIFYDPNPLVTLIATLLIVTPPALFFLTSGRIKVAISKGYLLQGSGYSMLPLLGLGIVLVGWSPILTSVPDLSAYGPIKNGGATLSVQPPQDCDVKNHRFRDPWPNANYNGIWLFERGSVSFQCTMPTGESLNISASDLRPSPRSKNENRKTVHEQGKLFEIHNAQLEKGPIFEVINFEGDDGKPVSVKHSLSEPSMYFVNRDLDDSFKISYTVKVEARSLTKLAEVDGQIFQYVKTITKRD